MNNRGFTLVELLGVIVLLALVFGISTYSIGSVIKNSKDKNYELLINNIKDAAEAYYQECKYLADTSDVMCYDNGVLKTKITLGDLVTYRFLTGNATSTGLVDPRNKESILDCEINLVDENGKFKITAMNPIESCPTEY